MPRILSHRRLKSVVATLVLTLFVQGCMQWQTAPLEPQQAPGGQVARVTLRTGEQRILRDAYIARDSVRSSSAAPIPLTQVIGIERRVLDGATTGVLLGVGVVAAVAIAVATIMRSLEGVGDIGCLGFCN